MDLEAYISGVSGRLGRHKGLLAAFVGVTFATLLVYAGMDARGEASVAFFLLSLPMSLAYVMTSAATLCAVSVAIVLGGGGDPTLLGGRERLRLAARRIVRAAMLLSLYCAFSWLIVDGDLRSLVPAHRTNPLDLLLLFSGFPFLMLRAFWAQAACALAAFGVADLAVLAMRRDEVLHVG